MMIKPLRTILYEYASERGGGLPLSAEEVCNAVVLWVQQYVTTYLKMESADGFINVINDNGTYKISINTNALQDSLITADYLFNKIKGSETVVVDIGEDGNTLEVHLDGEVVAKLNRAILQPVAGVTEDSVPVVTPENGVEYKPLSEIGGGGGGTKLYLHKLIPTNGEVTDTISITTTRKEPITNVFELATTTILGISHINTNHFALTHALVNGVYQVYLFRYIGELEPSYNIVLLGNAPTFTDTVTEL